MCECEKNSGYQQNTSSRKTTNPNPLPIGIRFGFVVYGGRYKTRTCDLPHVKRMRYQLRQSSFFIGMKYNTSYRQFCQDLFPPRCGKI